MSESKSKELTSEEYVRSLPKVIVYGNYLYVPKWLNLKAILKRHRKKS